MTEQDSRADMLLTGWLLRGTAVIVLALWGLLAESPAAWLLAWLWRLVA
jgi:hypothetical protein